MRTWIVWAALSLAAVACTSSAGRSKAEADVPVNPVDSLLTVLSGQVPSPELKLQELCGTYGDYSLTDADRTRLAEGFAAVSRLDDRVRDSLLPALAEELRLCETFADICRRLGVPKE